MRKIELTLDWIIASIKTALHAYPALEFIAYAAIMLFLVWLMWGWKEDE